MKRKPQPERKRPVVAVTLSTGALAKLKRLTRAWGKTYDSHTVEKLIDDAAEEAGRQGNYGGSGAPVHPAQASAPAAISQQLNETKAAYRAHSK